MRTKYIIFDGPLFDYPVVFPEAVEHSVIARQIGHKVAAAGFVCFVRNNEQGGVEARCYGNSVGLKSVSRPQEDARIINHLICGLEITR